MSLLLLGDSIAIPSMGCGDCRGFDERYSDFIAQETGRTVDLRNEARPDAQMNDLLHVIETDEAVRAAIPEADVIVVSIGYNDGPPWGSDSACHPPVATRDIMLIGVLHDFTPACIRATLAEQRPQINAVYAEIADLAGDRAQLRVDLGAFNNLVGNPGGDGTLPAVWSGDANPRVLAQVPRAEANMTIAIDGWNEMDCAAAMKHGFVCADIYHAFNGPDGGRSLANLVNPSDYVHPNVNGQRVIAKLLEEVDLSVVRHMD